MTGNNPPDITPDPAGPGTPAPKKSPVPDRAAKNLVERVTALRGPDTARPRTPKSTLRRRSLQDIHSKDPEIPYVKFETASRDLVCSLMERQDRMIEEIFNRLVDFEYRLKDVELDILDLKEKGRS